MELRELRIGNLYSDYNGDLMVMNDVDYVGFEFITNKPIPLNEEWLLKFGFDKFSEISGYFEGEERYCCEYILTYDHEITNNLIEKHSIIFNNHFKCDYPHIKHVHQLQNLYFAITGEELKLEDNA